MFSIIYLFYFLLILPFVIRSTSCYEIKNGNPIPATANFDDGLALHGCQFPDQLTLHVTLSTVTSLLPRRLHFRLRKCDDTVSSIPYLLSSQLSTLHTIHARSSVQTTTQYSSPQGDLHLIVLCSQKSKDEINVDFVGIMLYHTHSFLLRPKSQGSISPLFSPFEVTIFEMHREPRKHLEKSLPLTRNSFNFAMMSQRRRRAVIDAINLMTFTIDVLVVVDYSVYSKWHSRFSETTEMERTQKVKAEIKRYYKYVLDGIDSRYSRIDFADFSLRVHLVDVVIIDEQAVLQTNITNNKVNADESLKVFRNWTNETRELRNFDHAILFVGYDLYTNVSEDNRTVTHTSGLAYIGTMCQPGDSVSIVEEQGGFQSIGTAAHELGHSLGALHDGEMNTCQSEDRYIMAASGFGPVPDDKQPNPWQFSNCSVEYFRNFIATRLAEGKPCLRQSGSRLGPATPSTDDSDAPDVPPSLKPLELPGQHYDPDEQCRLIWGPESYLCRGAEFGDPASLCTAMYCRDPATANDCVLHTAAAGTSCGNKKWCVSGECRYDDIAPPQSDSCVLGDQPGKAFNGLTCSELVDQRPSYCYQEKVRARCCKSCDRKRSNRKGCEYGDRTQGCQAWHCGHAGQMKNILSDCCSTCSIEDIPSSTKPINRRIDDVVDAVTHSVLTSGCKDTGVINGLTCQDYVKQFGNYICYDRRARDTHCCATCGKVRSLNPDCEYGDRTPYLCAKIANLTTVRCSNHRDQCCDTCYADPEAMSEGHTFHSNVAFITLLFYLLTWTDRCILG